MCGLLHTQTCIWNTVREWEEECIRNALYRIRFFERNDLVIGSERERKDASLSLSGVCTCHGAAIYSPRESEVSGLWSGVLAARGKRLWWSDGPRATHSWWCCVCVWTFAFPLFVIVAVRIKLNRKRIFCIFATFEIIKNCLSRGQVHHSLENVKPLFWITVFYNIHWFASDLFPK